MNFLALALSMTFLLNPLNAGISLSKSGDYEGAEIILKTVPSAQRSRTYYFFRTLDAFQLNHKQDVLIFAEDVLNQDFMKTPEVVPTRYIVVVQLMKADAKRWKDDPNELESVSRDMADVAGRLEIGKGGEKTQAQQREILAKLDKHIKDLEDKKKQADANEKQKNNSASQKPADDSVASQPEKKSNVAGTIDQKKLAATAADWGKLNEKDRAAAMKDLVNGLDPAMRDIIERYFIELSKREEESP